MTQTLSQLDVSKILAFVPSEKVFQFCTSAGVYTGVTSNSLENFGAALGSVEADSLLFHYPRGDFQAWIRDVVGDNVLADRLCFIQPGLSRERLRRELVKIVRKRLTELRAIR